MDLRLEQFAHTNVKIVPDTMSLLTDTELTQYYIQAWTLDYNHPGTYSIQIFESKEIKDKVVIRQF